jgi:hypothetical protein
MVITAEFSEEVVVTFFRIDISFNRR